MKYFNFLQGFYEEEHDDEESKVPSAQEKQEPEIQERQLEEQEMPPTETALPPLLCDGKESSGEILLTGPEVNNEQIQKQEEDATDLPRPKTSPEERRQEF